jgi:hypothetical protein
LTLIYQELTSDEPSVEVLRVCGDAVHRMGWRLIEQSERHLFCIEPRRIRPGAWPIRLAIAVAPTRSGSDIRVALWNAGIRHAGRIRSKTETLHGALDSVSVAVGGETIRAARAARWLRWERSGRWVPWLLIAPVIPLGVLLSPLAFVPWIWLVWMSLPLAELFPRRALGVRSWRGMRSMVAVAGGLAIFHSAWLFFFSGRGARVGRAAAGPLERTVGGLPDQAAVTSHRTSCPT